MWGRVSFSHISDEGKQREVDAAHEERKMRHKTITDWAGQMILQVARLHYRITCLRDDALQKLTTRLAQCYGIIGIEDLHVKGLLKNRCLSRSFSDAALGKLRDLLSSKVEQCGGQVIKIGRFFPSSKTCHCCGWKWEAMTLNARLFLCQNPCCPYYRFPQDRDHNAGQNILREALHLIGLIDRVVTGIGSDEDVNLPADAG
jgi:putative transposase